MLIIATTSTREVLDEMEMITAFTDVLHIPNLHRGDQVGFFLATFLYMLITGLNVVNI